MPDMSMKRQLAELEEREGISIAELRKRGDEARRKASTLPVPPPTPAT